MQIPVIVESIGSEQFRAQGLPPFAAVAEGKTQDEAVCKIREQLQKEVKAGKQIVMVEIPGAGENPLLAMAGWLKDDPMFDEWQAAIQEYRRERDIEDGIEVDKPE